MKIKNQGKVYPSPHPPDQDPLSVLQLLPAAILVLLSVLSSDDREVLAYLVTRSLKTTTSVAVAKPPVSSSSRRQSVRKKPNKKRETHKPPVFDCDCFECYTSYWCRWDSSPNRELIHLAIEAFEDHLTSGETEKKCKRKGGRGKKKEECSGRSRDKVTEVDECVSDSSETQDYFPNPAVEIPDVEAEEKEAWANSSVCSRSAAANNHKGLARKVLPDVLGLFNSRWWSLWNPGA